MGCVRRYCEIVRIWKSSSFVSENVRGELEDVGELGDHVEGRGVGYRRAWRRWS